MKVWKILGTLVVVAALGGTAFGAATMLPVHSNGLQAGSAPVPTCQPPNTPVTVSYGIHFAQSFNTVVVDHVFVTGISDNCVGGKIDVVLTCSGPCADPFVIASFQDLGRMDITGPTVVYKIPDLEVLDAKVLSDVHVVLTVF